MRPPRRLMPLLTPLVLFAAGAAAAPPATLPTTSPATPMIDALADPEPLVRQHAMEGLLRLGDKAAPALREAARDGRPAVADAAAALLLAGKWYTPADAPSVRLVLLKYGALPPAGRAEAVRTIVAHKLPDFRRVALRVLSADPSDEVAWQALSEVVADPEWEAEIAKADPARLPPSAVLLLAAAKNARGDTDGALALVGPVLDRERDRPTTSARSLVWAVATVVDADTKAGRYAAAAARLREQSARADDQSTSQSDLIERLLDLHARHGPLPGFDADLRAAGDDTDGRAALTLGLVARRAGLTGGADALVDAALRDHPREDDNARGARLMEAGKYLRAANQPAAAVAALERVTKIEAAPSRARVVLAYAWLSELHGAAGEYQQAGDDLQRAIDRQESPLSRLRNGRDEPWAVEDEQARVYWYYLMDAQQHGDDAAAQAQVARIVAGGSTDAGLFLEAFPAVRKAAGGEQVDAYFERVFAKAKARLDAATPDTRAVELNDLAWLCARSDRRLPEAVVWAGEAVSLKPNESAYLDTLAEAKFRTGAIDEAIALETKALVGRTEDEPFMREQLERFRKAAATRPAKP